ncbi:TPA: hypothetical protein N0F65_012828 [Lagenidium giganteum]|uniref:Protein kinase domain-containing protein n=1 Tax=Lagenidium giganteum TaxID=4803 RepID=A0AAV2YE56_9STRA|nr:TPA: hypothetical protein N0F65_012828 [Lagenidium giganteum]
MVECVVARPVFARLPSYNPFVGTFHHAPSAGNRGAVYFSGDIVGMAELEERKKFRQHPLTGTFHSLPGYYDPLHRLSQFRNNEEDYASDTESVRSFVAVDITDSEDMDNTSTISQPKSLNRMHSDSHCVFSTESFRPRRFSDSDAESFFTDCIQSKNSSDAISANQRTELLSPLKIEVTSASSPTRSRSKTLPAVDPYKENLSQSENTLRNSDGDLGRSGKKRKSSAGSCNSTESDASSLESFVLGMERAELSRSTSAGITDGFISTGKGIFRKVGYRTTSHHNLTEKEKMRPMSPCRVSMEEEYDHSSEYTQAAPRIPLNPFVARRLSDGEQLRIMAIHRDGPRSSLVINPIDDGDDEGSLNPKPYFIHEKAVTEQYELCGADQLGDGSYAVVKPAIRRANGKEVAIKQIHKRFLRTEEAKNAVDREIEIHLRLKHRHVVRLYEVYETDDFLYLVMAKATKGNLKQLMQRKRRVPEGLAAKLAQQIVRAVFFLHDSGVLHCDLKPENILLSDAKTTNQDSNDANSPTGRRSPKSPSLDPHADVKVCDLNVELCDFGLSVKVPDVRFYKLTGDVHKVPFTGVTGTPGYIAPELLQQQPYGKPVDMWSVGIVIYEMLTGYQPFYPPHACINECADFTDRIWNSLPQAKDLVMHLLQSDPTKRFTAADALSHTWFESAAFAI